MSNAGYIATGIAEERESYGQGRTFILCTPLCPDLFRRRYSRREEMSGLRGEEPATFPPTRVLQQKGARENKKTGPV